MSDSDRRYEEIRRRIAARKNHYIAPTPSTLLETTLDQLNVYDQLEEFCVNRPYEWVCYTPTSVAGRDWAGVLIWFHKKGYYGYRQLVIFGVWVRWRDEQLWVIAGNRQRDYAAAVYNPESFHKLIQKGIELYYNDDGSPPKQPDVPNLEVVYTPTDRLTIRQQLIAVMKQWYAQLKDDSTYNSKNPSSPSS